MSDVLLVDLSAIVHPLWHMSGREPDPNWTAQSAVRQVLRIADGHTHVAVCADRGRSFRKALSSSYKANRPEQDAPLHHQLRLAEEELREAGFPVWAQETYEADDIIATAVQEATGRGLTVTIATSDKDLMTLVDDQLGVELRSTHNDQVYTEAAVAAKFGVKPTQMGDYLALVGDASDNVKGVAGVGPKTAAVLLTKFGTLEAVIARAPTDVSSVAQRTAIAEAARTHLTESRQLIALRPDATIPFEDVLKDRVPVQRNDAMTDDLKTPASFVEENQPDPTPTPGTQGVSAALVKTTTVDVEPFTGAWTQQLEPRNPADARTIAKWVHTSRLFQAFGSPEAVFSIILAGRELNLGTMASLRGFHMVEGRPTIAADLLRGLVLASGKADYFTCTERTPERATWVTKRQGSPHEMTLTYTLEEAKLAGLVREKSGWVKHPADMCAKSASTKLCRLAYADLAFGLYSPEELGGEE